MQTSSFMKNLGSGIATSGGYIVGTKKYLYRSKYPSFIINHKVREEPHVVPLTFLSLHTFLHNPQEGLFVVPAIILLASA